MGRGVKNSISPDTRKPHKKIIPPGIYNLQGKKAEEIVVDEVKGEVGEAALPIDPHKILFLL